MRSFENYCMLIDYGTIREVVKIHDHWLQPNCCSIQQICKVLPTKAACPAAAGCSLIWELQPMNVTGPRERTDLGLRMFQDK